MKDQKGKRAEAKKGVRRAVVTPEGGEPVEVEVPADHPAPDSVAVVAYRHKQNAWGDDRKMAVTFPDD